MSLLQIVTTMATAVLAFFTYKSVEKAGQSIKLVNKQIELEQNRYERDNTPLLVFDFNLSGEIFVESRCKKNNNEVPCFYIKGILSNISKTPAQQVRLSIVCTDCNCIVNSFDKDIFIINGIIGERDHTVDISVFEDDVIDRDSKINRVPDLFYFLRSNPRESRMLPFVIIFSYQNRFGDFYHSVYGLKLGKGLPENTYSEVKYYGQISGKLTMEELESIQVEFGVVKTVTP